MPNTTPAEQLLKSNVKSATWLSIEGLVFEFFWRFRDVHVLYPGIHSRIALSVLWLASTWPLIFIGQTILDLIALLWKSRKPVASLAKTGDQTQTVN